MSITEWNVLPQTKTFRRIISDWETLLSNQSLREIDYHQFLFSNPSLFLSDYNSYLTISKLKLGSVYETDFVNVYEGYSDGTIYELVEIETPHTQLFNSNGSPTKCFNNSLQQIRDWKRYLNNNKSFFQKYLPSTNTNANIDSRLKFKIIIGRRSDNREHMEKRRQISMEENVEIISYDRLTDTLKEKNFADFPFIFSSQFNDMGEIEKNELANPFYECLKESTWKQICNAGFTQHFYYNFYHNKKENRKFNDYFKEAQKEIDFIMLENYFKEKGL